MTKILPLLVFILLVAYSHRSLAGIPPEEAAKHIGETVTVEGVVSGTHTSGKGNVFLNFGGKYPNQVFTGYLPAASAAGWSDSDLKSLLALTGKTASVTGKVEMYKGKPEIVLSERNQVKP